MQTDERPPAGPRGHTGALAETAAAEHLAALGWTILARNIRVDGVELDIVARPAGPEPGLVVVEVRARTSPGFGSAVESIDRSKVARLYRAALALRYARGPASRWLTSACSVRVDLVALRREVSGAWSVEAHLRGLEPPA